MADNIHNSFTCNIKEFIIDEIALEGLEGITPKLLWKRLAVRISAPITEKMKIKCWDFILNCKCISIYKLREPLPDIEVIDRLTLIDPETGYLKDPDDYLDGPYEYAPIDNENGSSVHYNTRTLISDATSLSYDKINSKYGEHLALVASLEERWKALAPGVPLSLQELVPLNFCMLELIGRSRGNGQMTTGKSNLMKIVKDPKILFYHRKALQNLDIVRVTCLTQVTAGRAVKSLLIRLKRFHKSDILTVPKSGLLCDIVDHLKTKPNFCEKTEMIIKQGLMNQSQSKRFQKKVSIFHFGETPITSNSILGASATSKSQISKDPKKVVKKRYMYLVSRSDESSQSEEEENSQPLKCQYKIGVNVLRQAYERFLEAGRNGLTQLELAQLVGVEFYVSRSICRIFKGKNIIREFIECKGRQRMGRYIAIAATSKMDSKLAKEKEKLIKLLDEGNKLCKQVTKRTMSETSSDSEKLIVKKKRKMENIEPTNIDSGITEIKIIDGIKNMVINLEDPKSKVSLRQLKFMNGILKVIHERTYVLGYQTLSNFVSAECNEPPMDTKAMKLMLQGMVSGGNLKVYRMKLPRSRLQYTVVICAPHIKPNDPLLQAKYNELVHKVSMSQKIAQKKLSSDKPLSQYAYPRYVKVQKLHEAIVKIMYFNDVKSESSGLPQGFFSLKDLIPELTVGVSLGHISSEGVVDIARFPIVDNLLDVKIRDAPTDLKRVLLKSNNLQASLRTILRILAQFGLVQLIVQSTPNCSQVPDNTMTINMFYVNKHAKIIDTSGVWPREGAEYKEREFYFENFGVVQEYWQAVYHISTNTTIEVPNRRQKNIQFKAPIRTIDQALECDNGERFGNGKGPCGFDSLYYLEIPRLWKSYCIRSSSLESKLKKSHVRMPKLDIPKKAKVQKKKKIPIKKPILKKPVVAEVVKRAATPGDGIKKRPRNAKNWTLEEDRLLMMCKTAITIMSPISQPGSLRVRNIVARDILSIRDPKKTQSVCHKRAALIETNSTLVHERNCILNELRRQNRISKYEGLLKNIRILYSTNLGKYINEARMPMMELVWILYQLSKNMSLMKVTPWVTLSLEEFNEKYTIAASSTNQPYNLYTTPHENGVTLATLKEAIMLTVMLSFNNVVNKETAEIVYAYFHKYSENDLRTAIEPLRKCGAIAAKDKMIRTQLQIIDLDDIVQCSYRISAVYQRKWISRLNSDFPESVADYFNGDVNRHAVKASPEANCFFFESQGSGILEIVAATVPVITGPSGSIIHEEQLNVIDIATNFKLKSGTIGWKNKTNLTSFSELHKNINVNEALDYLSRRSFIRDEDIRKDYDLDHNILSYLEGKCEKGATFKELKESLEYDSKSLTETLSSLQTQNIIKRIGFYENVVVLIKYVKHWCMMIPGGYMIPVPWLTLESKIRPDIFFKWAGVVMNKVFEYPGCSLSYLSESCEFLTIRAVQDICETLQKCECVSLYVLLQKEPSLFFDDDDMCPELIDYNEFESPLNIVVIPVKDCITKYSYIKSAMFINDDSNTISTQVSEDSQ